MTHVLSYSLARITNRTRSVAVTVGMLSSVLLSTGCAHVSQYASHAGALGETGSITQENPTSHSLHDPALLTGTLPNGMRYYIRSNPFPAKRANLWLAVNAGSINEDDDQRGFAHFLEHMAFNGTKHFPGNSVIDFVEQSGMIFGSDLNAYTSFEETVYQLTIPTDDKAIFTNGLQVIDDWASGGVLMDSSDVVAERGVVLGEWRARLPDTVSKRMQMDRLSRTYGEGSLFAKRFPIGDPELLKTATSAPITRFYRDWYRPDLMAVIVVGDFDAKAVERDIRKRFGTRKAPEQPRQFERPVVPPSSQTVVHSLRDKTSPHVEFAWPATPLSTDPALALRQQLIDQLTLPYLQRTFTALSKKDRRVFAQATISRDDGVTRRSQDRMVLRLIAAPDTLMQAFRIALTEVERVAQHGISDTILAHEKHELLRKYQAWSDGSSAIASRTYAQEYTQHYLTGRGYLLGPGQALALVERVLPTISSTDIAHNLQGWRNEAGRVVTVFQYLFSPVPKIATSEVNDLLREVAGLKLSDTSAADGLFGAPNSGTSSTSSLLSTVPKAGSIVSTKHFEKSDLTVWTLSNGARVVYKHNASQPDNVLINAYSLGGHSLLPDSVFASPARLVGMLMTASGGFATADRESLVERARTTGLKEFQVALNAFNEEITIGGSPRELEYLFQLLYLQFTAPTVDTLALADWRRNGGRELAMSANDRNAYSNSWHRRLVGPSSAGVPFVDLTQAMRLYHDRFGDASDFTFYIAGPSDPSEVLPFVTQYVASLPSTNRTVREVPRDFKTPLRKQIQRRKYDVLGMPPEKAQMKLSYSGAMPKDSNLYLEASAGLSTASWILGRRLRNLLREEMGVTYNASAPYTQYWTPDPRYVVSINVMTDPLMLDSTVEAVLYTVDQFRKHGPTDEELTMANAIRARQLENASQSNTWWINRLEVFDRVGMSYDYLEHGDGAKPLTKEQIRTAANTYFSDKIYVLESVTPDTRKKAEEKKGTDQAKDKTPNPTNDTKHMSR